MKASKSVGSGSSALHPCFRQQLSSERLAVPGTQLIQQPASNCYPSSSFNTPHPPLTTRLSFFVADKENKRRHVRRECGSVRLFLCVSLSLFFSPSHQWVKMGMNIRHGNISILYSCFWLWVTKGGKWRAAKGGCNEFGVIARGWTCIGLRMTASESKTCQYVFGVLCMLTFCIWM